MIPGAYDDFPEGFFDRTDDTPDSEFYAPVRLVTHLDSSARAAVGELYLELGLDGSSTGPRRVLDLMSSWISHFLSPPAELTVLGMNALELEHNRDAASRVVHDLNADPRLPFTDESFDGAVCCVSVDYLIHPIEVFDEVARVLVEGGVFAVTFSNRCFSSKAITGWLATDDITHVQIVAEYFRRSTRWHPPEVDERPSADDPLFAVWARRA